MAHRATNLKRHHASRFALAWPLLVLTSLLLPTLAGCGIEVQSFVDRRLGSADGQGSRGDGSAFTVPGDPARLEADLERAVDRQYWGLRVLTDEPSPTSLAVLQKRLANQGVTAPAPDANRWRIVAVLPDDRRARIEAWAVGKDEIGLWLRVGRLGDPEAERDFRDQLAATLAGKPKPTRGGDFKLPDDF